jgi:hypothetical protein
MELFWKPRVDAGFLDFAHQLLVELLVAIGFALQRLIFEGARVEASNSVLVSLTFCSSIVFAIGGFVIFALDALGDAGVWWLRSAILDLLDQRLLPSDIRDG